MHISTERTKRTNIESELSTRVCFIFIVDFVYFLFFRYPKGKTCAWHFVTTPGHRLSLVSGVNECKQNDLNELSFKDFQEFVLEDHSTCRYDKVQLFDGNSESAPSLGVYCGSVVPTPIVSTDNQLFMLFSTDASVARRGFTATYSSGSGCRSRRLSMLNYSRTRI